MSIIITPIPSTIELAAPAFNLGLTNTAGAAVTAVSSNSTLLTFDATVPTTIAYSDSAATGSQAVSARRDHAHGMAAADAVAQADQTETENESDVNKYVPPDLIRKSPGVCKAWLSITAPGANQGPSYNVDATTDTAVGNRTINFTTDFSSVVYVTLDGGDANGITKFDTRAEGSVRLLIYSDFAATLEDRQQTNAFFGDQD